MRKTLLAAAAVAAVLSTGAVANQATAMPAAAATQLGLATPDDANLVQNAAVVCGYYGCRHVWGGPYYWHRPYWAWHRHYWGWHRWW